MAGPRMPSASLSQKFDPHKGTSLSPGAAKTRRVGLTRNSNVKSLLSQVKDQRPIEVKEPASLDAPPLVGSDEEDEEVDNHCVATKTPKSTEKSKPARVQRKRESSPILPKEFRLLPIDSDDDDATPKRIDIATGRLGKGTSWTEAEPTNSPALISHKRSRANIKLGGSQSQESDISTVSSAPPSKFQRTESFQRHPPSSNPTEELNWGKKRKSNAQYGSRSGTNSIRSSQDTKYLSNNNHASSKNQMRAKFGPKGVKSNNDKDDPVAKFHPPTSSPETPKASLTKKFQRIGTATPSPTKKAAEFVQIDISPNVLSKTFKFNDLSDVSDNDDDDNDDDVGDAKDSQKQQQQQQSLEHLSSPSLLSVLSLPPSSPASAPAKKTAICPMCHAPVDAELLQKFSRGKRLTVRAQSNFCREHKRHAAMDEWEDKGYPKIDWDAVDNRLQAHDEFLSRIIEGGKCHFGQELEKNIKKGSNRMILKSDASLMPGYYGPRGFALMSNLLTQMYGSRLRKRAVSDRLISGRGTTAYLQAVLLPEATVRLIMQDMGVGEKKARQIMAESIAIGELVHDEVHQAVPAVAKEVEEYELSD